MNFIKFRNAALIGCFFLAQMHPAHGQVGSNLPPELQPVPEGVRWDRVGKRWIYSVLQPNGTTAEIPYTPESGTEPRVTSKLKHDGTAYNYTYKVLNHKSAVVAVDMVSLRLTSLSMPDYPTEPIFDFSQYNGGSPQFWAIHDGWTSAQRAYKVRVTSHGNKGWNDEMQVGSAGKKVSFHWQAVVDQTSQSVPVLMPGKKLKSLEIVRAELPGAVLMNFSGWTPDFHNAGSLPTEGVAGEHAALQTSKRYQFVAVLAPAIVVPSPYNGPELIRRLSAHVATWYDHRLATPDAVARLQAKLGAYGVALNGSSKSAVRAAAEAVFYEAFLPHPGLHHGLVDEDDDDIDNDNARIEHGTISLNPTGKEPAIHRVASRALAFNVMYALTRAELSMK